MKKFFLFTSYVLSVAIIFLTLDFVLGKLFDKYLFLNNDSKMLYAHQGGDGEEIVVLGASRASHHYCPSILESGLGGKCYNYGMDGRNIFNQYVVEDELLTNSLIKPQIIVLEIAAIDIANTPGFNGEKLSNLHVLYKQNKKVREIIDKENPENKFFLGHINLYRYNSRLLGYLKGFIYSDINDLDGYEPLYNNWREEAEQKEVVSKDYYPLKELYFRKFVEYSLNYGIKLLVFNSPEYYEYNKPIDWERRIEAICKEYNVPFYNHAHDSLFLKHREYFNEPFHLNDVGAKVYSEIVVKDIKLYLAND